MHLVAEEQSSPVSAAAHSHHDFLSAAHATHAAETMTAKETAFEASANPAQTAMADTENSAATNRVLGLRTYKAAVRTLTPRLDTWARVVADAANEAIVTAPAEGWIKRVYVPAAGIRVAPGAPLFELYSPELEQRQRDYIDTLNRRDQLLAAMTDTSGQNGEVLGSLARERKRQRDIFLRIGIDQKSIDSIEQFRRPLATLTIVAAQGGLITAVNAREGAAAGPATPLFTIVDDNAAQLDVILTPSQYRMLSACADVSFTAEGESQRSPLPLRRSIFNAELQSYVVRTPWRRQAALQPGAVIDVSITSAPLQVLAIPKRAILEGPGGAAVVLAANNGGFITRRVATGAADSLWIEIKNGIAADDTVITDGQFLLDADTTLQNALPQSESSQNELPQSAVAGSAAF
jgi:Cu(I)/Ag(I) efflux system membrane fusion protein